MAPYQRVWEVKNEGGGSGGEGEASRHAWAWWRQTESGCPPIDLDEVLAASFIAVGHCLVCHTAQTVELENMPGVTWGSRTACRDLNGAVVCREPVMRSGKAMLQG